MRLGSVDYEANGFSGFNKRSLSGQEGRLLNKMSRQFERRGKAYRNSGISRHRNERGRGGWRGGRGISPSDERSGSSGPRHPPGLHGKAIGLWYRDKRILMKKNEVKHKSRPIPVELDPDSVAEIRESLENVKVHPPDYLVKKHQIPSAEFMQCENCEEKDSKAACSQEINNAYAANKYGHLEESKFKTSFLNSITGTIEENLKKSLSVRSELSQIKELDEKLLLELKGKNSSHYHDMLNFRKKLPSYSMKDQILSAVESNQVVVISGETGCGKTTQVAQFILDHEIMKGAGSKCHLLCTQPRRISAISVAERVADERDERIGEFGSVGYQIRLEKMLPRNRGSILFCTTGILLQYMQSNPALTHVSHIIIDEIHERDILSDFSITILKDVLAKRQDLKLILMSATLNAERFSQYYNNCPMLTIPGFTFPVTEYYLEDVLEALHYDKKKKRYDSARRFGGKSQERDKCYSEFIEPYVRNLRGSGKYSQSTLDALLDPEIEEINLDLIFELIRYICYIKRDPGAILVFLPGWDKISALFKQLNESNYFPSHKFIIHPLHSMMPTASQKSIFNRPPPGVRKIVIATNIAETSITIDDIVYVIDCGKIKMKNFDIENNISTLQAEWVSLANAKQRRGRAGRVQAGICYHLFSRAREMSLTDYPLPEMLRTRLEEVILRAKILQLGYVKPFLKKVMDPPDPVAIDLSLKMLLALNAVDDNECLTPLGYHLAQLPLDPQTGKMILMGSLFNCIDPIFSIAASLSFKDAFIIPIGREREVDDVKENFDMGRKSDHIVLAEAFSQWELAESQGWGNSFCQKYFLSRSILFLLKDMKKQFAEYLFDMKFLNSKDHKSLESNINSGNIGLIRAIICAGLYPNIAVIRKVKIVRKLARPVTLLTTPEDGNVGIHPKSVNSRVLAFESNFLIYHLKLKTAKISLHDTSMIHPLPLIFFGHSINTYEENRNTIVELSDSVRFSMSSEAAKLITELRIRLDWLLEKKISNPGVSDWTENSDEGFVLRAITRLITVEDRCLMEEDDESSSFSD